MVLLELATYFFGATVSLVIAVFLLGVNIEFGKGQAFSKVKHYMAICALIDLCLYSCDIMCMYYGVNYLLLDPFLVPVTFYLQLYLLSFAFFGSRRAVINVYSKTNSYQPYAEIVVNQASASFSINQTKFAMPYLASTVKADVCSSLGSST